MNHGVTYFNSCGEAVDNNASGFSFQHLHQIPMCGNVLLRAVDRGRQLTFNLFHNFPQPFMIFILHNKC